MNLREYLDASPRGTATSLSDKLGISVSYLSQMASGGANISPKMASRIESETDGNVTRQDIYPDDWRVIWPELAEKDAA